MTDHRSSDLEYFLRVITPTRHDPTYSLLRAHLLFEEVLNAYLESQLRHPGQLDGQRLSFAQRLAIARACSPHLEPSDWRWEALAKLNQLRNTLAHKLEPTKFESKSKEYVTFIETGLGRPLPSTSSAGSQSPTGNESSARYLDIDMVNAGLFASLPIALGLSAQSIAEASALPEVK